MLMTLCSDFRNAKSSRIVPEIARASWAASSYNRIMPFRLKHDWFLEQWMAAGEITSNEELRKRTGWSKRKASELISGSQRFNRDTLNEAALALNCAPWELLMHPDEAMRIRRWRADIEAEAVRLVAEKPNEFRHADQDNPVRQNGTNG